MHPDLESFRQRRVAHVLRQWFGPSGRELDFIDAMLIRPDRGYGLRRPFVAVVARLPRRFIAAVGSGTASFWMACMRG